MERKAPDREIDARIEALARRQHGALARRQAIELGASAALVQRRRTSKRWRLAAHGVYVLAGWPPTFHQRVAVAVLRLGPDAFAAASCAAMLRNLDGIDVAPIEIATPRPPATPPKGITVRRALAGAAFDDLDGIPTATATEIVVQLAFAPDVPFSTLESVFECAQRRKLTTHAALAARMAALSKPGVTGVQAARARLRLLIDDGAVNHSDLETRFFQLLREEGLPLPERQQVVARGDGRFASADYGYPGTDGLVELVGFRWHSASEALRSDIERGNEVVLARKRTVQFTWHHVTRQRRYVVGTMRRFLRQIGIEDRDENAPEWGDG